MHLSNNPTRRLQRRRGALERFPGEPPTPSVTHLQGANNVVRVTAELLAHAKRVDRWRAEKARLVELCTQYDENFARSIKTKKDHSHLAKLRFGTEQR